MCVPAFSINLVHPYSVPFIALHDDAGAVCQEVVGRVRIRGERSCISTERSQYHGKCKTAFKPVSNVIVPASRRRATAYKWAGSTPPRSTSRCCLTARRFARRARTSCCAVQNFTGGRAMSARTSVSGAPKIVSVSTRTTSKCRCARKPVGNARNRVGVWQPQSACNQAVQLTTRSLCTRRVVIHFPFG